MQNKALTWKIKTQNRFQTKLRELQMQRGYELTSWRNMYLQTPGSVRKSSDYSGLDCGCCTCLLTSPEAVEGLF